MNPAAVLLSSSLASHSCTSRPLLAILEKLAGYLPLLCILVTFLLFPILSFSQSDTTVVTDTNRYNIRHEPRTIPGEKFSRDDLIRSQKELSNLQFFNQEKNITPEQKKKRIWFVAVANVVGYSGIMVALSAAWYKDFPKTSFHTFNDWPEWKQTDKIGHLYGSYIESRASSELWKWTGLERKKRIWIGGMSGAVYQTIIEYLDGHSAGWGWSWGDFSANIVGSGVLIAQELAWNEQRIKLKWSFHRKTYADASLNQRSDVLFGKSSPERFLKDYNGQTYWASANLKSFFPKSNLPPWLSLSFGYGAEGMFGGTENIARDKNGNIIFNRADIKRYRQWYLSPDIDLTKIKTKSKGLKFFFTVLSAFKFPLPSLEFSNGTFKAHALHF